MKHRNKKKTAVAIVVVLAVVGASGGIFIRYQNTKDGEMKKETINVTETQAKTDTISNEIVGTGNLETGEAVSVKIPSGLTISEVAVESGDYVSKGDVLAYVDTASVLSAIEEVQSEMESLDEEIYELQEEETEEEVTVKVDGRIKKIYIAEGSETAGCILENGALMLVSADGLLAVDLSEVSEEIKEGDTVKVIVSGGKEVEGTVEHVSETDCTVTMTDSGVGMGDTASVTNESGTVIGTGTTYIHQPIEITANPGVVSEIYVSEDEAVESGDALFTMEKEEKSEYAALLKERESLSNSLKELLTISEDGKITADMAGIIEEIYISSEKEETAENESTNTTQDETEVKAVNMTYEKSSSNISGRNRSSNGLIMLSTAASDSSGIPEQIVETEVPETEVPETEVPETEVPETEVPETEVPETEVPETEVPETEEPETEVPETDVVLSLKNTLSAALGAPETGASALKEIQSPDGSYTGSIKWNPDDDVFQGGVTYQAQITLEAQEGYIFGNDSISGISSGIISGMSILNDGKSLSFTMTFPETKKQEDEKSDSEGEAQMNQEVAGTSSERGGLGTSDGGNTSSGGGGAAGVSASSGHTAVSENSSEEESTTDNEYSTATTAFTIAGKEEMILAISVDELDINSVEKGQQAEVTFDAIEEETFEGTVTKVGNSASASGGVAKYTVEITIPASEEMKVGMNASATIVIEKKENIITIPVNALQERGDEVFVYTEKDAEGNLSGEKSVSTGLSDGNIVEITEGLSEGDTIYYQKIGTENHSSENMELPGGNMEFPGGDKNSSNMEFPGGNDGTGGGFPERQGPK